MGFEEALKAHYEVKVRLILFMNNTGHLTQDEVAQPEQCALGKWLKKAKISSPDCDIVNELIDLHNAFHSCAAQVVALLHQGNKDEAKEFVQSDGQLTCISNLMSRAIEAMKQKNLSAA